METQILSGVPANKVDDRVAMFKAAGATDVKTKKETDGTFTITATFPN